MNGVEQSKHTAYVELSDKYAHSVSKVAQLIAENEQWRNERETARAAQAKSDTRSKGFGRS